MPSIDEDLLFSLYRSGKTLLFAEQNNGYIWQNFLKVLYRCGGEISAATARVFTVNTLDRVGKPQFIHSATYEELIEVFGLSAAALARTIQDALKVH
jgi:hypothetical protein